MSKSIYEEAIADAKKVREAAEVNAKNAILESVTPKIREFIEQAILEQDKDPKDSPEVLDGNDKKSDGGDDDEKEKKEAHCNTATKEEGHCNTATKEEAVALDESAISALLGLLGGEDILDDLNTGSSKRVMNSVVNEAINNLSESEREKLFNIADKLERNADILESNVINNDVSLKENNDMAQETFYEVDLRALKRAVNEGSYGKDEGQDPMEEKMGHGDHHSMEEKMGHHSMEEKEEHNEGLSEKEINELMMMLEQDEEEAPAPEGDDDMSSLFGPPSERSEDPMADVSMDDMGGDAGDEGDIDTGNDAVDDALEDLVAALKAALGGEGDEEEVEMDVEQEPAEDEGGPEGLEEVYEIDPAMLRRELRNIRKTLREGKGDMESQFGGKGHANVGIKNTYGGKGTGKIGVKRAFGGGSEGQDAFTNPPQINKLNEALRQQVRLNRDLSEKLTKYRGAVKSLREQLEDLNLFNAKLLYVNKLLQNKSLTESQRKSIIKALDKAGSINEAKTLFKSLTETFSRPRQGGSKTLTESRTRGSSSRPTTSAASKNTGNAELGRWAKLAGLK